MGQHFQANKCLFTRSGLAFGSRRISLGAQLSASTEGFRRPSVRFRSETASWVTATDKRRQAGCGREYASRSFLQSGHCKTSGINE